MVEKDSDNFFGERDEEDNEENPDEYTISAAPNDFNVKTLFDFIDANFVKIPGFQRNYVWDIKKGSRLIESLIMGIPVPQLFLYEKGKNDFLVIDGQQRLMTIYYFLKGRFPRMEKRAELRRIIDKEREVPKKYLQDNTYFTDFTLNLTSKYLNKMNRLNEKTVESLYEEDKNTLMYRPIRCVFIKQISPSNDSSMYEIFFRLNTGGENLTPQEIRSSLYYSPFYDMLTRINLNNSWRRLTTKEPDRRMRDIEILLRGFAMLVNGNMYKPPMVKFLNNFSEEAKKLLNAEIDFLEKLFNSFLESCDALPPGAFQLSTGRFSASVYEAIFTSICKKSYEEKEIKIPKINPDLLKKLKEDGEFLKVSASQTTSLQNVKTRLERATDILFEN